MSSSTANIANIQQSFMNNVTQLGQENCVATTDDTASGNVIIVSGVNIGGNFTGVTTTVSTDATCYIVSNMEDSISNIISATLQQSNTSETDWFNGFEFTSDTNTFNMYQSVTNNISQINEAMCAANTTVSTSDNYIYVSGATVGGNFVGVSSNASTSANCEMTNSMKNTTYTQATANGDQDNTVEGMFVAIAGTIATVVGLIVITVIILVAVGAFGFVGYEAVSSTKKQQQPPQQSPQPQQQGTLAQLEQLEQLEGLA